jgi:hypothetical protein
MGVPTVIPAFERLKQEDSESKASLGYIAKILSQKKNDESTVRSILDSDKHYRKIKTRKDRK